MCSHPVLGLIAFNVFYGAEHTGAHPNVELYKDFNSKEEVSERPNND